MKNTAALLLTASLLSQTALADNLKFHTYNPQENSIFPVTSVIVEGDSELMLVDAQFQRNDALKVVSQLQSLNKPLKIIYISHYDPDFYFGLDVITQAFPKAKVIATPETANHIQNSIIGKYNYWSPILKENAPKALVLPQPFTGNNLTVGNSRIAIKGQDIDPAHTYLWDTQSRTLFGGVQLYQGMHLWLADSQTAEARSRWQQSLQQMAELEPKTVIPGHFIGTPSPKVIQENQEYLRHVEKNWHPGETSKVFIQKIKAEYPNYKGTQDLELSAKVLSGEMKWPQ
ncbi:hypothetical protein PL75_06545 [Neisseria arctica]|uniref:Metallo-beta-lactamase domain-containing protein n=1 Tax=Neisseria arctica TaxID=1470200 RepID=A0A0J1C344_9NEIS|nr:MBL fold metallo-hydrolase [Neisseria arctica]KLT72733.1 hypothetical protein PL75_06545 [Neisseria arctica]UOO87228.1 MBL fold metallo-hydrolase [Neisseria arctica]